MYTRYLHIVYVYHSIQAGDEDKKESEGAGDQPKENESKEDEKMNTSDDGEKKKKKVGCNNEEVLAVLCHELGHWYHSHVLKQLVISQVGTSLHTVGLRTNPVIISGYTSKPVKCQCQVTYFQLKNYIFDI